VTTGELPRGALEGVRRFNAGEFFEAHEAFEECLDEVEDDDRWALLLGLIQVSVGYHKHTAGHPGAERMLRLGAEKLAPLPDVGWGVQVDALRRRVADDLAALARGDAIAASPRIWLGS
jgi:predicted metal-dependent hydrolase